MLCGSTRNEKKKQYGKICTFEPYQRAMKLSYQCAYSLAATATNYQAVDVTIFHDTYDGVSSTFVCLNVHCRGTARMKMVHKVIYFEPAVFIIYI